MNQTAAATLVSVLWLTLVFATARLVPSYQLLYALQQAFSGTQRLVLFGMLDEFKQHTLAGRVRTAYLHEAPLQVMLARLVAIKARA
jgi:hypothetical protein